MKSKKIINVLSFILLALALFIICKCQVVYEITRHLLKPNCLIHTCHDKLEHYVHGYFYCVKLMLLYFELILMLFLLRITKHAFSNLNFN